MRQLLNDTLGVKPEVGETSAPAAPAPDAAPTGDTEASAPDKPKTYRAKRAQEIAEAILAKLEAGEDIDDNDLDDIPRLPKKWAKEIADARQHAPADPAAANEAEGSEQAEEPVSYIVFNDDGGEFSTVETPDEWVKTMIERIGDTGSADGLKALGVANKDTVAQLIKVVSTEDLKPVTEAYAARQAEFADDETTEAATEAPPTDDAEDDTKDAGDDKSPSKDDLNDALRLMIEKTNVKATEAVLKQHGASSGKDLKPEQYADVIAEIDKQIAVVG